MNLYGHRWLIEAWQYIQEDRIQLYQYMLSIMPVARTAMDKKSASALGRYEKKLHKQLKKALPWRKQSRINLPKGLEPGKIVVVLDGDESPDLQLYEGATITRSS